MIPVLLVHGGAGDVPDARIALHVEGCARAARIGLDVLLAGGDAIDAVQRAVEQLEDDPLFNAGTGGSLTEDGLLELDAAIMDGALRAGAVCSLPPFAHPIAIARAVLDDDRHVLLAAEGAARFAASKGFSRATLEAMRTQAAIDRLEAVKKGRAERGWAGGTVGAVAIDEKGHVAAATSTGGTVGKRAGRVGDSPIVGAGTYADDEGGACSATGVGEAILKSCLAFDAVTRMRTVDAQRAAEEAIARFAHPRYGGSGGIILVDREGRAGVATSTRTMTHAIARAGEQVVARGAP